MRWLERTFDLQGSGSKISTEIRAGIVTFLTLSYILFVNPQILSQTGMPAADVAFATAVASAAATLMMGLWANYPIALAPGMGLNAYFTFGVVAALGIDWRIALAAVFVEGLIFLLLALTGVRQALLRAIPQTLKIAIMGGIGLFLALIGFENAGLVVDHPETLVTLGDLASPPVLIACGGLILIAVLMSLRFRAAILVGILAATATAWSTGISPRPEAVVAVPTLPTETFLALDFQGLFSGTMAVVIISFLFVDIFDTAGTLIGVGRLGGFVDQEGNLPRANRAFAADAIGTTLGALLGTSTITSYVESATGVEEGGRTGLTAVVIALCFILALFFTPILVAVPPLATAPALIIVGALMMRGLREIEWQRPDEAVPAFLTMAGMPFTYSIATGITFGIISYVSIKVGTGRREEVHPILYFVCLALIAFWALR